MTEPPSDAPADDQQGAEDKPGLLDRILGRGGGAHRGSGEEPVEGREQSDEDPGEHTSSEGGQAVAADAEQEVDADQDGGSQHAGAVVTTERDDHGDDARDSKHSAGSESSERHEDAGDRHEESHDSADTDDSGDPDEHDDLETDQDGEPSVGAVPAPEDVDQEAIEKDRAERLDPDNRPENVEIDNTDRDFDSEKGMFTDAEGYEGAEKKFDDEAN